MAEPNELLVEGDACDSCAPQWAKQGQPPRILIALNVKTGNHSYPVVVCPYCDGQPILDLQPSGAEESPLTDENGLPRALPNKRMRPDGSMEPYEPNDGAPTEEV